MSLSDSSSVSSPKALSPVGFNLLVWTAAISEQMNPIADRLKTIGYDGVECFIDTQDVAVYQKFGDHLKQTGLQSTCVTVVGPDTNPASESASIRQQAVEHLKGVVDRAHAMGASVICGPFHSAFATFTRREPQPEEYDRSADVLHTVGDYARQAGIVLTPEALNRFECYLCNTMEQLAELVRRTDHPNVRAMFDTHHANMEEKRFPDAIRTIAPYLAHVHISENDRGTPGDGHIPWDDTFRTLAETNYQGWMTIEAFTRNDIDFANSINVWREFSSPWDIAENGLKFIRSMQTKYAR
ncbi:MULTISPECIES: sugar phosphate isomerase/epimerase [unclassified Spirosoma]|uniref:sugar phosphate isomerase/epimerase family protein n=1 Tax=unclassified Spirosoma TaxID=2621999 RepID=UPI00096210D8|nr:MULTISPECIES: sugar phosphate isomerase/epimerase family protein [unclassified Spirosoma]MBN8820478.1 sugar phosphate isomerase/epimerase [Spirosoma sp.]OJW72673.1 MAG: xylose isomerase [Spirosoma sp. 48-14]